MLEEGAEDAEFVVASVEAAEFIVVDVEVGAAVEMGVLGCTVTGLILSILRDLFCCKVSWYEDRETWQYASCDWSGA